MPTKNSENYEKMLKEVESIVHEISSDSVDLDQMVTKVEKGYELIQKMKNRLTATKENIEKLRKEYEEN